MTAVPTEEQKGSARKLRARAALFVADRHGEIVLRAVAAHRPVGGDGAPRGEGHGLPVDEILPLLELLQVRCAI